MAQFCSSQFHFAFFLRQYREYIAVRNEDTSDNSCRSCILVRALEITHAYNYMRTISEDINRICPREGKGGESKIGKVISAGSLSGAFLRILFCLCLKQRLSRTINVPHKGAATPAFFNFHG